MAAWRSLPSLPSHQASSIFPSWQPSRSPPNRWSRWRSICSGSGAIIGWTLASGIAGGSHKGEGAGGDGATSRWLRLEFGFEQGISGRLGRGWRHVLCLRFGSGCWRAMPDVGGIDRALVRQLHRPVNPFDDLQLRLVVGAVLVLHRLGARAGDHRQLAGMVAALLLVGLVDLADGVAHVDGGARQLDGAAEERLREDHQDEAALEALAGAGRDAIEGRVDHLLRRLALAQAHPAGADVGEVGDEGGPADLDIALVAAGEPLVGLGVVLGVGLVRAGSTDIERHWAVLLVPEVEKSEAVESAPVRSGD